VFLQTRTLSVTALATARAGRSAGCLAGRGASGARAAGGAVRRHKGRTRHTVAADTVARWRQKRVVSEVKRKGVRCNARVVCQEERERKGRALSHSFVSMLARAPH
jgi:hypothetical protein